MRHLVAVLVLAGVLAGCAGPPDVTLGPAGSADPLQQLLALDETFGGAHRSTGNRVTVLRDGEQTFPAMFAAMAQARESIDLEYYTFDDVHFGGESLGDLLTRKLARGVAVNVIFDAFGSHTTPDSFLNRLKAAGARLLPFHPLDPRMSLGIQNPNDRDHRKIMVVDGRVGFVGGINLDRVYENPRNPAPAAQGNTDQAFWRDTDARIEGPAVTELQRLFMATWQQQNGPPQEPRQYFPPVAAMGDEVVRIIGSSPGHDESLYYVALLKAIHTARHSIGLTTGYFVPTHQQREELARAARRGVAVQLVLPSVSDSADALAAGRAAYGDLLEAGVRIGEVRGAVLHSKLVVVDGAWTVIGSSNFDPRSAAFNNEVDAIVLGHQTAEAVSALLERDLADAKAITYAAWRARPLRERLNELMSRGIEFLL